MSPFDVPIALTGMVLAVAVYLVHCQREHVARKAARRRIQR